MSTENPDYHFEEDFQAIIEADATHDITIVQFNRAIEQTEDRCSDPDITAVEIEDAIEELNEQWPYHDAIATVSGRLYLADDDMREAVPEAWGEPEVDTDGSLSYFVNDVGLQSMGVMAGEDGSGTRIAYAFAFPNEGADWPEFIMYPSQAAAHYYEFPTAETLEFKLRRRWPEVMQLIDNLVQPQASQIMIRRITALTRRLQPELADRDFRELFMPYLNQRLAFSRSWPYIVEAETELLCFDGAGELGKGFIDDEWVALQLGAPLSIAMRAPFVDFIPTTIGHETYVNAVLFGDMSSPDDEYDPAPIGVTFDNLRGFTSTRVSRTMVERALLGYQIEHDLSGVDAKLQNSDSTEVTLTNRDFEDKGKPPTVVAMEFLERDVIDFIDSIKEPLSVIYDTEEEAKEASGWLAEQAVNRLIGAGITKFELNFSGVGVQRPQIIKNLPEGFTVESGTFIVQVNKEQPLARLQHGDAISGTAQSFLGHVVPAEEDGETVGYRACPMLIADLSVLTTSLLTLSQAPLMEVSTSRRVAVALDGSVEVKVVPLERYRSQVKAYARARSQYRKDPVMNQLNSISEAFYKEAGQFQALRRLDALKAVARRIGRNDLPVGSKAALDVLESQFVNRVLRVQGDFMYPDDITKVHSDASVGGIVADVRNDIDDAIGPVFVITDEERTGHVYVPLSSLINLEF